MMILDEKIKQEDVSMFYSFQILFRSTLHANVVAKREAKSEGTKESFKQLALFFGPGSYMNNKQKFLVNRTPVTLLLLRDLENKQHS